MMKKEYDAVIVGGGPGGSSTALFLKKNGVDKVLLIDKAKFPRDKICGDAFSGKSVGIAKEPSRTPARSKRKVSSGKRP